MSIRDELQAAMTELEVATGNHTFEYRGLTFPYVPGDDDEVINPEIGGFEEQIQRVIRVRMDAMPSRTADDATIRPSDFDTVLADTDRLPPHIGKRFKVDQRDYRLVHRKPNRAAGVWVLFFGSVNR